ncbi:hypothetical protein [Micromonospora sp. NBC_01813]|uniref:hypothetical protein n=1 Tax=Micromonospora sp. NBC_01813 TaxID=2975988 RepID=UPI002DD85118|nr:hypothetical protein [Micromonospora sp. NBC_01813]WSA07226.1 hypothetical protein OG958_23615 [Micromonospora sp. NBC_01813]
MTVVLPAARSSAEARLYVELQPCDCGEARFEPQVEVVALADGDLATRYHGTCPSCGVEREFVIRLPADPAPATGSSYGGFSYGGPEPSQLIDPGQWLAVADQYADLVPADLAALDPAQRRRATVALSRAVAALDEVRKFIPADASEVPAHAFTSDAGRRLQRREPGRFRRDRLTALRDTYTTLLHGDDTNNDRLDT